MLLLAVTHATGTFFVHLKKRDQFGDFTRYTSAFALSILSSALIEQMLSFVTFTNTCHNIKLYFI